jgi:hypothetical protein
MLSRLSSVFLRAVSFALAYCARLISYNLHRLAYSKYTLDADYYLPILPLPPLWLTSRSIASLKWYVLFSLPWRPGFISHNFA